jgi:flagellar protein FlbD
MIELTRLNGNPILLNSDLIKIAEASPDTMLTLINGEKLIVREERNEVLDRVLAYRATLLANVARKLSPNDALRRAASLASIEFGGELTSDDSSKEPGNEDQGR